MPSANTKILEFNQKHKSDKATFIIYADIESLIVKIDGCESHLCKKVIEYIPSGFPMFIISLSKERKKISMMYTEVKIATKIREYLKRHARKIISFTKKRLELLTKEQQKSYENARSC